MGRAQIAATIRDQRNTLAPDRSSTGHKKRNTKKWCKGKVGVRHVYKQYVKRWSFGIDKWYEMTFAKCAQCGREEWRSTK